MTEETIALLRCPLCRGALTRSGGSLVCAKRHCFDVARQGHVNLVPAQRESFYRRELFESRAAVFAAGVFAPVGKATLWPRSGYLCQLRRAARGLLRHDAYDDSRVADYLGAHAQMLERRTITYTLPVDAALAAHLARMTPMLADVDLSALDLGGITEITIDMNLVAGTFGAQETEEQA